MKKLTIILSSLTLAAVAGFFFSSCTSETAATSTGIGAPTNVMALSGSSTSISIEWTRASGDTAIDSVIVSNGSLSTATATTNTATSVNISGLSAGTVYTISVASAGARSSSISWMTATRTTGLKLYQFSSNGFSALELNGSGGQATVVSASAVNAPLIDFYLEDFQHDPTITTASGISFEGAQFLNGGAVTYRTSYFDNNDVTYLVGGLDADYSATDFSTQIAAIASTQGNAYDVPNDAVYLTKGSRILLSETATNNFAKIEIVPDQTTHMLYSGSGVDKYVTVNVSYQTVVGKPYAARAHVHFAGRPTRVLVP
jgi:hypothetical protein